MYIPIAIAFTPNYFVPAATMLRSLIDASFDSFEVICLVTEEIPSFMQRKLVQLGEGRLKFQYIPLQGRLDGIYTDPRYTEAASFRLLLPKLLPDHDRIIYIDCDVVVRQDVGVLYKNTILGDNYLAAVFEAPIEGQAERFEVLGCNPRQYFNSGFLLMNLNQMRRENVSEKLLEACRDTCLEFPDQDALNQVCQGRVLALSPLYNGIRTFFLPQYRIDFEQQYSEPGLWKLVQRFATIHYTGGKPWNVFSVQFGQWWKVFYSLPKDVRALLPVSSKIKCLSMFYRGGIGKAIEALLCFYRMIRYR